MRLQAILPLISLLVVQNGCFANELQSAPVDPRGKAPHSVSDLSQYKIKLHLTGPDKSFADAAKQQKYLDSLLKRIINNWEPCIVPGEEFSPQPLISFVVNTDGSIVDANVLRSTGFVASDVAAMDAIWSTSPFTEQTGLSQPISVECDFADLLHAQTLKLPWKARNAFKASSLNPSYEPMFLYRDVPLEVFQRYPNEFSIEQTNLKELKISSAANQLRQIRKDWSNFFAIHPKATSSDIVQKQEEINRRYDIWRSEALLPKL